MGPDPPWEGANFWDVPLKSIGTLYGVCANTAELIGMPFGLWARMDRRNHVLDWGP